MIRANAELTISEHGPISGMGDASGYNRDSVEWVEGFIEGQRRRDDVTSEMASNLGGGVRILRKGIQVCQEASRHSKVP